jgi:hypothetical protein
MLRVIEKYRLTHGGSEPRVNTQLPRFSIEISRVVCDIKVDILRETDDLACFWGMSLVD